jgi:hypothetical protein
VHPRRTFARSVLTELAARLLQSLFLGLATQVLHPLAEHRGGVGLLLEFREPDLLLGQPVTSGRVRGLGSQCSVMAGVATLLSLGELVLEVDEG